MKPKYQFVCLCSSHCKMQYKSIKLFLSLLFFLLYSFYPVVSLNGDAQVLLQVKSDQLHDSDGKLSNWVLISEKSPCNWLGITCDTQNRSVVGVDLSGLGISGGFPNGLCRIRTLKNLTLTENSFNGTLSPQSLSPCSHLQVLELSSNYFTGELPDLSREFTSLQVLDLHDNNFFGDIPASFGRFPALKVLNLGGNYIDGSIPWFLSNLSELTRLELGYNPFKPSPLPPSYGNLSKLEILWLARANLVGEIPESIGKLVSLTNLDLSDNFLSGEIPHSIGGLTSVVQIELYNNNLFGELPESLVNLTALLRFDVSQNNLTGTVSHNIASMSLQSLNLNDNHFTGEIPEILASNPNLSELKLFNNSFSGKLPENLGKYNNLEDFDVSTNDFTGELPEFLCHRNKLQHLVVFNNRFSGKLPESYGECQPLYYVRMGNNKLSGELSTKFWGLPRLEFLEMYNNNFNGPISPSISRARNLTHLLISGNNFSGQIPSVICNLRQLLVFNIGQNGLSGEVPSCITHLNKLQKLDLHQNMFTGDLPGRLNLLTDLTELNLSNNRFTGKIPPKLGNLLVLAHLDLSNNMLTGEIPVELTKLKLNQFNISHNRLYGKVPSGFDNLLFVSSLLGNPGLCSPNLKLLPPCRRTKPDSVYFASILAICAMLTLGSLIWFTKTKSYYISKPKRRWKVTTFQKICFSEDDIIPHLTEENIIGSGASGQVYRVKLKTGETVAVKKLWSSKLKLDTESVFKSETDTLGRIRHGNIIKLLLCCSDEEYRILVYEYMENGSLGDVLHGERGGAGLQDWYRRFTIAVGAAQGLAYLHHDCVRTIVHRDVKSNNILLDAEMVPHLADFGLAKTLGEDDGSMSRLAGSYGYIAPEYAYTSKVNEKSDVYSFGILLMELITGKRPNDACFGENKDIVKWVTEAALSSCLERETTANESNCCRDLRKFVDPRLEQSTCDYEEIEKVLKVALLCTSSFPFNRPSMRSVVELLNAKGHKLTCPK